MIAAKFFPVHRVCAGQLMTRAEEHAPFAVQHRQKELRERAVKELTADVVEHGSESSRYVLWIKGRGGDVRVFERGVPRLRALTVECAKGLGNGLDLRGSGGQIEVGVDGAVRGGADDGTTPPEPASLDPPSVEFRS